MQSRPLAMLMMCLGLGGCYALGPGKGGGQQVAFEPPRQVTPGDVALPAGYRIDALASGLTYPSAVTVDDDGQVYVVEAGYAYGEDWAAPRLLRIEADGQVTVIASGDNPPWTGVTYHQGAFYLAQGGVTEGGRIVRVTPDGAITPIAENIPTRGDHHTNGPAVGPDGMLYFGAGSATNSGVVGLDNHEFGWLSRFPQFHDVPARDVVLAGVNFTTANPLTDAEDDRAVTGPYRPFGSAAVAGQVIPGRLPANGAIMRIAPEGGDVQLVAWGLRNPYGLAFTPAGRLFVTENQVDDRGSRPAWGVGDLLWEIDLQQPGRWHGWPDFVGGRPVTDARFKPPGGDDLAFVLAEHPGTPPSPAARFAVHASACGIAFVPMAAERGGGGNAGARAASPFGFGGHAFVAQFGDMAPDTGKVLSPVGFNVVTVDPETGVVTPFAANRGPTAGPASRIGGGGLERPIDVAFAPDGRTLYIADFGVMTMQDGPRPRPGTGVVWRVTRVDPAATQEATP